MGLAFYCFGHDIALRLASGQAFALKNAELGAAFGSERPPVCFLRGNFTPNSLRGLLALGVIPSELKVSDLAWPVAVQLELLPELAATHGVSADSLQRMGLRLDQNSLTDEVARRLLLFEVWNFTAITPVPQDPVQQDPVQQDPVQQNSEAQTSVARLPVQAAVIFSLFATAEHDLAIEAAEFDEEFTEADATPAMTRQVAAQTAVMQFFRAEAWPWEALSATGEVLRSVYEGQNGSWMCYTRILAEFDQVLFYSVCPIAVPPVVVPRMMEFLNRANIELAFGNFEMDFDTNSVRFRTSLDFTKVELTSSLLRNVIFQNLAVMDSYLPTILSIVALRESAMAVG